MSSTTVVRFVSIVAALVSAWSLSAGATAAAGLRTSTSRPDTARGMVAIHNETLAIVTDGKARLVARRSAQAPMSIDIGLPIRHQAQLQAFIATEDARTVHPLSQSQFDRTYGAPAAQVNEVASWLGSQGLRVGYRSPDGLMITADGTTGAVEQALHINVDQFRLGKTSFFAPAQNPLVPARLGVQSILGLESYHHATYDLHLGKSRRLAIPEPGYIRRGGFWPRDFRTTYDVAGHGYYGQGESLGFTLWGVPVSNSDFAGFHQLTGDPQISSCAKCFNSSFIQWIPVGGASTDKSALGETALDVEYGHGMAPNSHLRYYLARNSSDNTLALAIAEAANDSSLHIVSNSWGGSFEGKNSSFVVSTTNEFEHADAVGTTFYFSSGDNAVYSGCPQAKSGTEKVVPVPRCSIRHRALTWCRWVGQTWR